MRKDSRKLTLFTSKIEEWGGRAFKYKILVRILIKIEEEIELGNSTTYGKEGGKKRILLTYDYLVKAESFGKEGRRQDFCLWVFSFSHD